MRVEKYAVGLDVGSTTTKLVAVDGEGNILHSRYCYSHGNPAKTVLRLIKEFIEKLGEEGLCGIVTCGSGGRRMSGFLDCKHTNEIVAQILGLARLYPQARSILEIGGQDSKFMRVTFEPATGRFSLDDFAMNDLCAAGTGSFLDQQAEKLGIPIEELAKLADESRTPARIAGRCTVFAKSDIIHLQQVGTPLRDIIGGLCFAVVRNYRATLVKGRAIEPPVVFQGGVAFNRGVVRAFRQTLQLEQEQLIVPENHEVMSAYGCAIEALGLQSRGIKWSFPGLERMDAFVHADLKPRRFLERLLPGRTDEKQTRAHIFNEKEREQTLPVYLGLDVGSATCKAVLISEDNHVVSRRYRPVCGRPVESVTRMLLEIGREMSNGRPGGKVRVMRAGVTGSGRHMLGEFVCADTVVNEITAQARAAVALVPDADTIFEIGGQDSKFIRIERGVVTDFEMNRACAAGTGSFLEEQALRLEMNVEHEFATQAFQADRPSCLGERCTVFMESDIVSHQQKGASREQLVAGLAYSIVENYLNKVVGQKEVGKRVLFQGGVAYNDAVVAAFRQKIEGDLLVPPQHDITGAIGAAIIARESGAAPSRFLGFDLRERKLDASTFICKACPNLCEVKRVRIGSGEAKRDRTVFYGARCDMYDARAEKGGRAELPDPFETRRELLFADYDENSSPEGRLLIGLPQALSMWDMFPYFHTLLKSLGFGVISTGFTGAKTAHLATSFACADTCYPLKTVMGHYLSLKEQGVDAIFYPNLVNRRSVVEGMSNCYLCPYIQGAPFLAKSALSGEGLPPLAVPTLWFMGSEGRVIDELHRSLRPFGVKRKEVRAAHREAKAVQERFQRRLVEEGERYLQSGAGLPVAVIGRLYATSDPGVNMDLPRKLRGLGMLPIPMDMLPLSSVDITETNGDMYWRSGQQILAAAKLVKETEGLEAVYYSCYGCGPDTFILHSFRNILRDKPHLVVEVDEHAADAGLLTRLEAFCSSLAMQREVAGAV